MREDLLQFIWRYKKIQLEHLVTSQNEKLNIIAVGVHNQLAGPDFFNAKIQINEQLWAGNVEVHINSSDWYVHHHEQDPNYDNVILHVVWTDDLDIKRKDGTLIPTLELKKYIPTKLLGSYQKLFDNRTTTFINCEKEIGKIDPFVLNNWTTRLFVERLEEKSGLINDILKSSKNNWEQVLFIMLLKGFGTKLNAASFLSLAKSIDFSIIRKLQNQTQLESVLLGMAGLLEDESIVDSYYQDLKKEYTYLRQKFNLNQLAVRKPEVYKLRPSNFPSIRLSQVAQLYIKQPNLFNEVLKANSAKDFYKLFNITTSEFWDNHFSFGKVSKKSKKKLSKRFIDLLLINSIIPIRFCHAKYMGKNDNEAIFGIIGGLMAEENTITSRFKSIGVQIDTSRDSQSVLQLYNEYCTKNKCLQCAVGSSLLSGNI